MLLPRITLLSSLLTIAFVAAFPVPCWAADSTNMPPAEAGTKEGRNEGGHLAGLTP